MGVSPSGPGEILSVAYVGIFYFFSQLKMTPDFYFY